MRHLLAATCLTPVILVAAGTPAVAQTVISNTRNTPVATATVNNGNPDDLRIATAGVVSPPSGTAVTINSNNSVKNEGKIQITGANDASGIFASAGVTSSITNTGQIILDENYTPTDADTDGDIDGVFAQGLRRYGIRVGSGGTFTGNVANSGTITIEGNDSAAIALDSRIAGNLTSSGTVSVVGNNSYGIRAGDVTGNVNITGTVSVRGANAVGAAIDGNVGGSLVVQGAVNSTGYRYTTVPANTSKLDADDLLQNGPALRISGNVAGGILFDVPPPNKDANDTDEDDDGVADASEGTAQINSYGAAPAVQIGAADRDIVVGSVTGSTNGHGIVINGNVAGSGLYSGVAANGLVIGGLGGKVSVAGGMTVNGSVSASSVGGNASAIRIGDGAAVNELRIAGQVVASGGGTANAAVNAIAIDSGATVSAIRNSGIIRATLTGDGTATAILDKTGGVTLVENSRTIGVVGAQSGSDKGVAINLAANTSGVVVRQTAVAATAAAPSISGNILLGSGDDLLDIADGAVAGTTRFGAGSNRLNLSGDAIYTGQVVFGAGADTLALNGTSRFVGNMDFGGGADTLTLNGTSRFTGALSGSSGLAVNVTSGTLDLTSGGAVSLASLNLGAQGSMTVNIDAAAGTNTVYNVSGAATFAQGSQVIVNMATVGAAEGNYVIVNAGSLTGGSNLTSTVAELPFLFNSSISANQAAGRVTLNVRRKTASELGLNQVEGGAYGAVFAALDQDEEIADVFLEIDNEDSFRSTLRQMLPNHGGGIFESVSLGSRTTNRFLFDPNPPVVDQGKWGFWLQQVAFGTSKDLDQSSSYDINGWGASAGIEVKAGGMGNFGLSLAYLLPKDADGENDNEVRAGQYELGAYWRYNGGGFHAHARASGAYLDFDSTRRFAGTASGESIERAAEGSWTGNLLSAGAGLSYEAQFGRFSFRPTAGVDYYRLKEKGYTESGGGDAFDLAVDSRTSDELAASGSLVLGYDLGSRQPNSSWFRIEAEGGRRQILGGSLGATTARFVNGTDFVLTADERESGWLGRLRLLGGNAGFQVGGEVSAEEQHGNAAVAFRATLQVGL